jgi:CheY-like chemotaxis protein
MTCTVLVVDDDPACRDEYCDALENLGYTAKSAASAPDALQQIVESPDIGIVITDLEMPTMDGMSLLSEISQRFSPNRPIVTLVLTGHSSLQVATLTTRIDPPASRVRASNQGSRPTEEDLQAFTRMLLKFQHNKYKFFDPAVLMGPSWEILLDITDATLRGEAVPASSASASTHVPLSTALRHINNLVEAGLVRRWTDPNDKRRKLLKLEPHTAIAMQRYLETAWKLQPQIG